MIINNLLPPIALGNFNAFYMFQIHDSKELINRVSLQIFQGVLFFLFVFKGMDKEICI